MERTTHPAEPGQTQADVGPVGGEPSDDALVRELMRGRGGALDALYRRHAGGLQAFLSAGFGLAQPEDLVHDTFVAVIEAADQFDPAKGSFRGWLFRIARNRALDQLRRGGLVRSVSLGAGHGDDGEGPEPCDPGPGAAEVAEVHELSAAVRACLGQLPSEQDRELFVLYHLGGQVLRELAESVDKSISGVRKRLEATRERMQRCLRQKGVEA